MSKYRAAVIGCGKPSGGANKKQGFSIAYNHGRAYRSDERVTIAAAADILPENAAAFAEPFNVPNTYADYREMIDREKPDIVSICTWPPLHLEMVEYAAHSGVKMIWCEKPMAVGLDEVDQMIRVCEQSGTRLHINHQRRFDTPYRTMRRMIDDGALGKLERLEAWVGNGWDMMSWGTHWVDMHRFLMHDEEVQWVVAAAPSTGQIRYGHPIEDHMLMQFQFAGGVLGLIHLGDHLNGVGVRAIGSEGSVASIEGGQELMIQHAARPDELYRRYAEGMPKVNGFAEALKNIMDCFESGDRSEIDAANGAKTTEVVMAAYQSGAEGRKIVLPLESRTFNLLRDYR